MLGPEKAATTLQLITKHAEGSRTSVPNLSAVPERTYSHFSAAAVRSAGRREGGPSPAASHGPAQLPAALPLVRRSPLRSARGMRASVRVGAGWAGRVTAAQWVGRRWEKSEKMKVSQSGRKWVRRPERAYWGLVAPKIVA